MQVGTSHFVDRDSALDYYCGPVEKVRRRSRIEGTDFYGPWRIESVRTGGYGYNPDDIDLMVTEGSISFGKPTTLPPGAVLSVIPGEGRYQYAIKTPESPKTPPVMVEMVKNKAKSTIDTLARLKKAQKAYDMAMEELHAAAFDHGRQGAIEFAAKFPRRRVLYCAAMGVTGITVEKHEQDDTTGGRYYEYEFDGESETTRIGDREVIQPQFMRDLIGIEGKYGFKFALAGDIRLEFRGGQIHSELKSWTVVRDAYPGYKKFGR